MKYTFKQYGIKLFWLIANPPRTAYWFVVRPHTRGAKCLIENNGAFLLVRLNYAHRLWTLPGGGVHKNESFEQAAIRESAEEAGILPSKVLKLGEYTTNHQYKIDTVHVYYYQAPTREFSVDGFEIAEAGWFRPEELPANRSASVSRVIAMLPHPPKAF